MGEFKKHHKRHAAASGYKVSNRAFRNVFKTLTKAHTNKTNIAKLYADEKPEILRVLANELSLKHFLKISIVLILSVVKVNATGETMDMMVIPFRGTNIEAGHNLDDLEENLTNRFQSIINRFEDFSDNGSNWVMDEILETRLELSETQPLNGGCGFSKVTFFKNIKNEIKAHREHHTDSQDCFFFAIAYHFIGVSRVKKLRAFVSEKINKTNSGPMSISRVPIFLKKNPQLDIRINVVYKDGKKILPIYTSKNKASTTVNLLLHKVIRDGEVIHHFSYITDLSKFLRKTYNGRKPSYQRVIHCPNCLSGYTTSKQLRLHESDCFKGKTQKMSLSEKDIFFEQHHNRFPVPFIGFFDFESNSRRVDPHNQCLLCNDTKCDHKTRIEMTQEVNAYSYVVLGPKGIVEQKSYCGSDPVNHMLKALVKLQQQVIRPALHKYKFPNLTVDEEHRFARGTICHICGDPLSMVKSKNNMKVRDHDHMTNEYLGCAHDICNLRRKTFDFLPMYAHNFCGYDSHHILKNVDVDQIQDYDKKGKLQPVKISGIPYNSEKVRSLKIGKLEFLDSYSFLQGSLSEMTDILVSSGKKLNILKQSGLYTTQEEKQLLLRKGVFPYEFCTSLKKMKSFKKIPSKDSFDNTLTNSTISDEDYEHAKKVFEVFNCETMLDYMMLYVQLDTILLSEIFLKFRNVMISKFDLDPCRYRTLPSFAFSCMLKKTMVKIDRMPNLNIFNFLANNIRGGFSFIATRMAKASETFSMSYIDANNL